MAGVFVLGGGNRIKSWRIDRSVSISIRMKNMVFVFRYFRLRLWVVFVFGWKDCVFLEDLEDVFFDFFIIIC